MQGKNAKQKKKKGGKLCREIFDENVMSSFKSEKMKKSFPFFFFFLHILLCIVWFIFFFPFSIFLFPFHIFMF